LTRNTKLPIDNKAKRSNVTVQSLHIIQFCWEDYTGYIVFVLIG